MEQPCYSSSHHVRRREKSSSFNPRRAQFYTKEHLDKAYLKQLNSDMQMKGSVVTEANYAKANATDAEEKADDHHVRSILQDVSDALVDAILDSSFDAICGEDQKHEQPFKSEQSAYADVKGKIHVPTKENSNKAEVANVAASCQEASSVKDDETNPDGSVSKKKKTRSTGEFRPYSNLFGTRRGDQPVERREEREVHRLVCMAKMQCADRSFYQRPPANHMQYVHSLGVFYASQPILTTKSKVEQPAAPSLSTSRFSRQIDIPANPRGKAPYNDKTRQKLLSHRFPWLLHFPSPRSFGKVGNETAAAAQEQPHDTSVVDQEHHVYRIMI
jgi:hypothetical protein